MVDKDELLFDAKNDDVHSLLDCFRCPESPKSIPLDRYNPCGEMEAVLYLSSPSLWINL